MLVDVDLGLKIPAHFPLKIQEKLLVMMGEFYIGPEAAALPPKEWIVRVIVKDVEVGFNISSIIPCSILDKFLMVMG